MPWDGHPLPGEGSNRASQFTARGMVLQDTGRIRCGQDLLLREKGRERSLIVNVNILLFFKIKDSPGCLGNLREMNSQTFVCFSLAIRTQKRSCNCTCPSTAKLHRGLFVLLTEGHSEGDPCMGKHDTGHSSSVLGLPEQRTAHWVVKTPDL